MNLIREFLAHNTMMNDRLLDACASLTAEQLATSVEGTFGPLGDTLVHLIDSQDSYAARFHGYQRPERIPTDPFPGFDVLRQRLETNNAKLEEAAAIVDDGRMVQVSGDDPAGTWEMAGALLLIQVVNHATEHRSQIATILTQLGIEPPDMSGWSYFFDAGKMRDV